MLRTYLLGWLVFGWVASAAGCVDVHQDTENDSSASEKALVLESSVVRRPDGVYQKTTGLERWVPNEVVVRFKTSGPQRVIISAPTSNELQAAAQDGSSPLSQHFTRWNASIRRQLFLDKNTGALSAASVAQGVAKLDDSQAAYWADRLSNVVILRLGSHVDVMEAVETLRSDPHVDYASPNYIAHKTNWTPNDPFFPSSNSWGQDYLDLWGVRAIKADSVWAEADPRTQGAGITVAVVDTGVDLNHPDIVANLDTPHGWNFVSNNNQPMDDEGHGTHVTGTICASGNNGIGIIGIAPQAKCMPLKALDAFGLGEVATLAEAIVHAARNGAHVINNSWACEGCGHQPEAEDAVRLAHQLGSVVVFAAGNSNRDAVTTFPHNLGESVTVSSGDHNDRRSSFSNFGVNIDVMAPGGDSDNASTNNDFNNILSLRASGGSYLPTDVAAVSTPGTSDKMYYRLRGTSMASPHVAGAAALIRSLHPDWTVEQVRQSLRLGADDVGTPGFDSSAGFGRVNVAKSVAIQAPIGTVITHPVNGIPTECDRIDVLGTVGNTFYNQLPDPSVTSWALEYGAADANDLLNAGAPIKDPAQWISLTAGSAATDTNSLGSWDIRDLKDGLYQVRLTARDAGGASYEDRTYVLLNRLRINRPKAVIRAGEQIELHGSVSPFGLQRWSVTLEDAEGSPVATTIQFASQAKVCNGSLGQWDTTNLPQGYYQLVLTANLDDGSQAVEKTDWFGVVSPKSGWPVSLPTYEVGNLRLLLTNHFGAADVDGTPGSELLVAYPERVSIFKGDGTMLDGWPQKIAPNADIDRIQYTPIVGEFTSKGSKDVIAWTVNGNVFVWNSTGTLAAGWPQKLDTTAHVLADMNRDGKAELVGRRRDGAATFDQTGTLTKSYQTPYDSMAGPLAVDDMNGDGNPEVVFTVSVESSDSHVCLLFILDQHLEPVPGASPHLVGEGSCVEGPVLGNLDDDSDLEIVVASYDGFIRAFDYDSARAASKVTLKWPTDGKPNTAGDGSKAKGNPNSPTMGDIDGDGKAEVFAGFSPALGNQQILYGFRGDGTPLPGWPIRRDRGNPGTYYGFGSAAIVDVDGDNIREVVVAAESSLKGDDLHAFKIDGTEAAGFPKFSGSNGGSSNNVPAISDFDNDGLLDVVWSNGNVQLVMWSTTGKTRKGTSRNDWPMFLHDILQTSSLGYTPDAVFLPTVMR